MLVAVIRIEQRKAKKKKEGFPHVTAQNHVNLYQRGSHIFESIGQEHYKDV